MAFLLDEINFFKYSSSTQNEPAAQAPGQTIPDEATAIGKSHPFSKMAVTFEPLVGF